jgi:hypothetical protein
MLEHKNYSSTNYSIMNLFRTFLHWRVPELEGELGQVHPYHVFDGARGTISQSFSTEVGSSTFEQRHGFKDHTTG